MWKPHFKDEVLQWVPLVDISISSRSVSSTVKVDFVPGSPGPVLGLFWAHWELCDVLHPTVLPAGRSSTVKLSIDAGFIRYQVFRHLSG